MTVIIVIDLQIIDVMHSRSEDDEDLNNDVHNVLAATH